MIYIGIDPGKNGGIVWMEGAAINHTRMPNTEIEIWKTIRHLATIPRYEEESIVACIEWINPGMQGSAKSSVAKIYGSYMQLRGFLVAAGIPFTHVMPRKWQQTLRIEPRRKKKGKKSGESTSQWKNRLVEVAWKMFPKLAIWKHSSLGYQQSVADALLIAEFCRRTNSD